MRHLDYLPLSLLALSWHHAHSAISLGIFNLMMAPPISELGLMALFLAITALVSSLAGYIAYRLGWIAFLPACAGRCWADLCAFEPADIFQRVVLCAS